MLMVSAAIAIVIVIVIILAAVIVIVTILVTATAKNQGSRTVVNIFYRRRYILLSTGSWSASVQLEVSMRLLESPSSAALGVQVVRIFCLTIRFGKQGVVLEGHDKRKGAPDWVINPNPPPPQTALEKKLARNVIQETISSLPEVPFGGRSRASPKEPGHPNKA